MTNTLRSSHRDFRLRNICRANIHTAPVTTKKQYSLLLTLLSDTKMSLSAEQISIKTITTWKRYTWKRFFVFKFLCRLCRPKTSLDRTELLWVSDFTECKANETMPLASALRFCFRFIIKHQMCVLCVCVWEFAMRQTDRPYQCSTVCAW